MFNTGGRRLGERQEIGWRQKERCFSFGEGEQLHPWAITILVYFTTRQVKVGRVRKKLRLIPDWTGVKGNAVAAVATFAKLVCKGKRQAFVPWAYEEIKKNKAPMTQ